MSLRSTLAGGSIAILLLAGCATDAPAPIAEPPSTTPSSTPVETPVVTEAPDTLTPFSCDDLVPTPALVDTAAASLVSSPQPEARFDNAVRRQDGRMFCAWTGIDIRLYLQVSRGGRELIQEYDLLESPDADEENTSGAGQSALLCGREGEPIGCSFIAVTDGYVLRGSLSGKKSRSVESRADRADEEDRIDGGGVDQRRPATGSMEATGWVVAARGRL